MRIIAGEVKGRKLKSIKGTSTRPTLDRIKESLFNIITPYLMANNGLDLFAGFGGLGIEALSRGVVYFTFVEKDYRNCKIIKENIKITKYSDRTSVIQDDVFNFLNRVKDSYDLIIMDPPYKRGYAVDVLKIILKKDLLNKYGIVVVEHEKELELNNIPGLSLIKYKIYGDTALSVLKKEENNKCSR